MILPGLLETAVLEGVRGELAKLVEQHAQKLLQCGKISDTLEDEPFETRFFRFYEYCLRTGARAMACRASTGSAAPFLKALLKKACVIRPHGRIPSSV